MATQKSKATLLADIGTSFPNNTSGNISPAILRAFLEDLLESIFIKTDDQASFPLFGYKVMAGQHYWAGAQFDTLADASNAIINTGSPVTTTTELVAVDAGTTVGKWVAYFAQLSTEWGTYNLGVKVNGNALEIYPKIGGPKIEWIHAQYDGANWGLLSGGGSTMSITSESANQLVLSHSDCGNHPAWVTYRATGREVAVDASVSATSTTVNLRDSAGAAYTPATNEVVSIARLSAKDGNAIIKNPNELTTAAGRITYFGIYQE